MSRRVGFTLFFLVFAAGAIFYTTKMVNVPEMTFAQAANVGDTKVKVMVPAHVVAAKEVSTTDEGLVFYVSDDAGTESRVLYDGEDAVDPAKIRQCAQKNGRISLAGHVCGDKFHAKSIFFKN